MSATRAQIKESICKAVSTLFIKDSDLSFMHAYEKRPFLNGIVFFLWLSVVINVIKALYFLVTGSFGNIGMSAFWAVLSFTLWYAIHNWALRHPKR